MGLNFICLFMFLSTMMIVCKAHTRNTRSVESLLSFESTGDYNKSRNYILDIEERLMIGGGLILSEKENRVNDLLMKVKYSEIDNGMNDIANYPPAMHFFKAKKLIEKSRIFKLIQRMPKGANLHGHNTAMVSSEWLLKNVTYRDGISMCRDKNGAKILTFRKTSNDCAPDSPLELIKDQRNKASDISKYDAELEKLFNLYTPRPEIDYPDVNTVWSKFQSMFGAISDVVRYLPVFKDYHYQLLKEFHDDNVMYTEIRTSFGETYDENGNTYTFQQSAGIMRDVFNDFVSTHPRFLGVKTIYSVGRKTTPESIQTRVESFKSLIKLYPEFVVGFDLVGQEDLGNPLFDFIAQLKTMPCGAKFFFHAGETNWYGEQADLNLLDAFLLNTTRIGHGYALAKHPVIMESVRQRGIGIEISPLSNQILGLVHDLRNHPGAVYSSSNMPLVIASDDPGFWNSKGLSYDFYYALMSFAPRKSGLKFCKKLAMNSIKHSILSPQEQDDATRILESEWDKFLDEVLSGDVI